MASVTLTRNLGTDDAGALEVKPTEAREGKQVDVEQEVRDHLVLRGLAHEGEEKGAGGLDLNDPEIRKKIEEKELELNLAAGVGQIGQQRQRESLEQMQEIVRQSQDERDRVREDKRREGERLIEERRNLPPKGPEEQPRILSDGSFLSAQGGRPDVDEDEDQETRRREEEKRRRGTQPQPGGPQPGGPQPQPGGPRPGETPTGPIPSGPGKTGGGTPRK